MIESLLTKISGEAKDKGITGGDELGPTLLTQLRSHIDQLSKRNEEAKKSLEFEKKEQAKHITTDDLREGWSNTVCRSRSSTFRPDLTKMLLA